MVAEECRRCVPISTANQVGGMIARGNEACQAQRGRLRLGTNGERAHEIVSARGAQDLSYWYIRQCALGMVAHLFPAGEAPRDVPVEGKRLWAVERVPKPAEWNTIDMGLSPMGATAATPMTEGRTAAHTRQPDSDRRALARCAADGNGAGMFFHDLLHGRETQA